MRLYSLSDTDLWALIVSGNYRAFTALYERHWLKLYKTAQKYCSDNEVCEEMLHDLFVTIWNRREHLRILDVGQYLKVAIRHQVYAYQKKIIKLEIEYREYINDIPMHPEFNKGYEKILSDDLEMVLQGQLSTLPQRCREIFLLSRKDHLSNLEIAEKLGISKRSVENQITAALKHLRYYQKDLVMIMLLVEVLNHI